MSGVGSRRVLSFELEERNYTSYTNSNRFYDRSFCSRDVTCNVPTEGQLKRKGLAFGRCALGHSKDRCPNAKPLQMIGFISFSLLSGVSDPSHLSPLTSHLSFIYWDCRYPKRRSQSLFLSLAVRLAFCLEWQ